MPTKKISSEIQMVIDRIKNFDQMVEVIPHVDTKTEENINGGYDPKRTIQIRYE